MQGAGATINLGRQINLPVAGLEEAKFKTLCKTRLTVKIPTLIDSVIVCQEEDGGTFAVAKQVTDDDWVVGHGATIDEAVKQFKTNFAKSL